MKKYILFDHDGVLVDTEVWYFRAGERALADIGFTLDPDQYLRDMTDGSGTWAIGVERPQPGGLRWLGLDGVEHSGGQELVDFDADGHPDDRLVDTDGDGLADRVLSEDSGYVDVDGDGRWDIELSDTDGDGAADTVNEL